MVTEVSSSTGELRAAPDGEGQGIIEGYVAVWSTVDDYNSSFQRGAFTKTLQERGGRVKVLWNHLQEVIGRPLEIREDDRGLFCRIQLILATARAAETYELVKAGAIDTFSFGFRTIKDKWTNGVRVITEAALMEISPVVFEANSHAVITGVRAMPTEQEKQATVYAETYGRIELNRRGQMILNAIDYTLSDVWYSQEKDPVVLRGKIDAALSAFTGTYLAYTDDLLEQKQIDVGGNAVEVAMRSFLSASNQTPEQLAASTSLTLTEVRSLLAGRAEVDRSKWQELPEEVQVPLSAARLLKIDTLCNELRGTLDQAEIDRIRGLLATNSVEDALPVASVVQHLTSFRASLKE